MIDAGLLEFVFDDLESGQLSFIEQVVRVQLAALGVAARRRHRRVGSCSPIPPATGHGRHDVGVRVCGPCGASRTAAPRRRRRSSPRSTTSSTFVAAKVTETSARLRPDVDRRRHRGHRPGVRPAALEGHAAPAPPRPGRPHRRRPRAPRCRSSTSTPCTPTPSASSWRRCSPRCGPQHEGSTAPGHARSSSSTSSTSTPRARAARRSRACSSTSPPAAAASASSSSAPSRTRRASTATSPTTPSLEVVGQIKASESSELGFLPPAMRARAQIIAPGTMITSQPLLPAPVPIRFPYPPYATRVSEVLGSPRRRRPRRAPAGGHVTRRRAPVRPGRPRPARSCTPATGTSASRPQPARAAADHDAVIAEIVAIAAAAQPDLIVHTGDLFDGHRPAMHEFGRAIKVLRALAEVAPVVVLAGNHDSAVALEVLGVAARRRPPRRRRGRHLRPATPPTRHRIRIHARADDRGRTAPSRRTRPRAGGRAAPRRPARSSTPTACSPTSTSCSRPTPPTTTRCARSSASSPRRPSSASTRPPTSPSSPPTSTSRTRSTSSEKTIHVAPTTPPTPPTSTRASATSRSGTSTSPSRSRPAAASTPGRSSRSTSASRASASASSSPTSRRAARPVTTSVPLTARPPPARRAQRRCRRSPSTPRRSAAASSRSRSTPEPPPTDGAPPRLDDPIVLDGQQFDTLSSAVAHVLPDATVVGVVDARNPLVAVADELDAPRRPATVHEAFRAWLGWRRHAASPSTATGSPTRPASPRCSTSSTPPSPRVRSRSSPSPPGWPASLEAP